MGIFLRIQLSPSRDAGEEGDPASEQMMSSEKNVDEQSHQDIEAIGIKKIPTGIAGFDEITNGGLPFERTTVVVGGAGTGKTVFALQYLVSGARRWQEPGIFVAMDRVSLRDLRVVKYRGSAFAENEFPLVIGSKGIEVATFNLDRQEYRVFSERVPTGIPQLDEMLEGGYFRASTTLISGAPGTVKSTLATAFVHAASERGEPALYISFDEATSEIVRNMEPLGIFLQPYIETGLLHMHSILAVLPIPIRSGN